jgi:CRISPR/Cas system CSM-associated protein Csm2 small subunit
MLLAERIRAEEMTIVLMRQDPDLKSAASKRNTTQSKKRRIYRCIRMQREKEKKKRLLRTNNLLTVCTPYILHTRYRTFGAASRVRRF